jgi:predicted nucleic acid-binding protein
MTARTFVDSNVLIYAHDADAGSKQRRAADYLTELWKSGTGLMSTQVLQEFYVNVTRKIGSPLAPGAAREVEGRGARLRRLDRIRHHGGNDRARLGNW